MCSPTGAVSPGRKGEGMCEFGDMVEAGIIDPAKVSRTALEMAASVAGLMLTTDVLCTEFKEDKHENIEGATH